MSRIKKGTLLLIILIVNLAIILTSCKSKNIEPVSKTELLMGTVCTIKIYDKPYEDTFNKAFNRLKDIEKKMTINDKNSEVDMINLKSGEARVKVSKDTYYVIQKGKYYSELSKGGFDISIGPLVKLWGIGTENARVPKESQINKVIPLINYKNILLDDKNYTVMLKDKEMIIDLGGIAKGYAADEVKRILEENGVKKAIINLGGNVLVVGEKEKDTPWVVGVQNPDKERGDYIGTVEVKDKTVVSSGIYERYFEKDGKRYHHILDRKTGYPVFNSLASVTIITDKSIDGDALSTSVFSMGLDKGMEFVKSLKSVEGIFITKDSEVYITDGLRGNFKITDTEFKLNN